MWLQFHTASAGDHSFILICITYSFRIRLKQNRIIVQLLPFVTHGFMKGTFYIFCRREMGSIKFNVDENCKIFSLYLAFSLHCKFKWKSRRYHVLIAQTLDVNLGSSACTTSKQHVEPEYTLAQVTLPAFSCKLTSAFRYLFHKVSTCKVISNFFLVKQLFCPFWIELGKHSLGRFSTGFRLLADFCGTNSDTQKNMA